jgi:hypothetical protein
VVEHAPHDGTTAQLFAGEWIDSGIARCHFDLTSVNGCMRPDLANAFHDRVVDDVLAPFLVNA